MKGYIFVEQNDFKTKVFFESTDVNKNHTSIMLLASKKKKKK